MSVFPQSCINILFNLREHRIDVWEGRTDKDKFFKYQAATPSFFYTTILGVEVLAVVIRLVIVVVVRKVLVTCCYKKQVKCSLHLSYVLTSHKTMSGLTLEELLEKMGVSFTQLDETCTREHLQDIALFLESWRTVAPHLGLSKVQIEEVE